MPRDARMALQQRYHHSYLQTPGGNVAASSSLWVGAILQTKESDRHEPGSRLASRL